MEKDDQKSTTDGTTKRESTGSSRIKPNEHSHPAVGNGSYLTETMRSSIVCNDGSSICTSSLESASQERQCQSADIAQANDEALKYIGAWSAVPGCSEGEAVERNSSRTLWISTPTGATGATTGDQKTQAGDEQLTQVPSYLEAVMDLDALFKP
ncbi:hypothetical protein AYO20_04774 [Fonsecaea nubica]|uniref:Uncharacterized protein n=1 Tax=Fonsecaea nubica TaxID=856822 RepID=A0A178D184_9EURO|nr:hypothetical protein AYO20_04774 [Fonsecaea nubica]OAL35868.1 hypothetical protein AYO20_04774 [Fonsecaea nubica]